MVQTHRPPSGVTESCYSFNIPIDKWLSHQVFILKSSVQIRVGIIFYCNSGRVVIASDFQSDIRRFESCLLHQFKDDFGNIKI